MIAICLFNYLVHFRQSYLEIIYISLFHNGITLADSRKWLKGAELAEFRWSVREYIAKGENNAMTGQWMKELENASSRVHISRLESLQLQLQQQAEVLYGNQMDGTDRLLRAIYQEGYYRTAFEVQRGTGIGWSLHSIQEDRIQKVLSRPWTTDMRTFRDRCWVNKEALVNSVNTQLTQLIMRGAEPDKTVKAIADQFNVSKSKAGRLVMTESAAFASAAQKDCFNDLDVEQYRIVETLDNETCLVCGALDGTVLSMSEYAVGVTAPPFHPWCRGCTCPHFDDGYGERVARDADGRTYKVPGDMTYKEWHKQFIEMPEEMRYNKFRDEIHERIRNEFPLTLNQAHQDKHITGTAVFDPLRSTLTADPTMLINLYAGKGIPLQIKKGDWNQRERFIHTSEIGIWRDKNTGSEAPTNVGIIHYTKRRGAHIVPANPKQRGRK